LSIRLRLVLFGLMGILGAVAIGAIGLFGIHRLDRGIQTNVVTAHAMRDQLDLDMMHDALRADVLAAVLAGTRGDAGALAQARAGYAEHRKLFLTALERLSSAPLGDAVSGALATARPHAQSYVNGVDQAMRQVAVAAPDLQRFDAQFAQLEDELAAVSDAMVANVGEQEAAAARTRSLAVIAVAVALVGGVLLVLGMAVAVTRAIVAPLGRAIVSAEAIGAGDLTREVDASAAGEIGALLRALSTMQANLRGIIGALGRGAQEIGNCAAAVASSSSQIAGASAQQTEAAAALAAAVEQGAASVGMIADNADHAHAAARDSSEQCSRAVAHMHTLLGEMSALEASVKNSAATLETLGENSREIRAIVSVIGGIAEQTNLLALNAAIEAARAGEHGRGFAVVADEVRKLSDRTAQSTREIAGMIEGIQGGVAGSVGSMQRSVESVTRGLRCVEETQGSISTIREGTDRVLHSVADISVAIKEQSNMAIGIGQDVECIAHMAERNDSECRAGAQTARSLQDLAGSLQQTYSRIRLVG